jgi:hypothetical protein
MLHFGLCIQRLVSHIVTWNALAILWLLWAKDNYKIWRWGKDSTQTALRYIARSLGIERHTLVEWGIVHGTKKKAGGAISSS